MTEAEQTYQPLVAALKQPLPDNISKRQELRSMVAFAESYGIVVSQHRRTLVVDLENRKADALLNLKKGLEYDDEGQVTFSEDAAKKFEKMNADEKKIVLNREISWTAAELEFVTQLEELIKRRCSLGQTISNSFNTESSSAYNN